MAPAIAVRVTFDESTLLKSGRGSITGRICVEAGDDVFPNRDWSDFVVVVLGWWLDALAAAQPHDGPVELLFMDGPFAVSLTPIGSHTHRMEWNAMGSTAQRWFVVDVHLNQLLDEVLGAATKVLAACDARGWRSPDIDALRDKLTKWLQ